MTSHATRLWALDGAWFTVDTGLLVVNGSGDVTLPVPTFLIEHPRGLVLFDTGVVPQASVDPHGVYGELAEHVNIDFTPDKQVDRQIEALGFSTTDVTHVVVSHSHFDHTGGMYLFPQAKFFIGGADLPYAYWPMPAASVFFRTADLDPTRGFDWNPLAGDHDLFADGSVTVLSMPGHTPGNSSLMVRLANRTFMLTGDTVHVREALDNELPMPSDYSTKTAVDSVRRLAQLSAADDADIWIAHDPQDWAKFFKGAKAYE
ncbi:MAG: MBL fold metallo-hydrolase [Pseudonocardiaceae bacterium]|nr:MBL fold metallo-hydrolase [Pseudonocardiaceae bacterium]